MLLAFSRLGCIVYKKESAKRRQKPNNLEPAYIPSKGGSGPSDGGENGFMFMSGDTPPTEDLAETRERGFLSGREKAAPSDKLGGAAVAGAGVAAAAVAAGTGPHVDPGSPAVKQQKKYRDLFGTQRQQLSRRLSNASMHEEEYENDAPTNANTKANALSQARRPYSSVGGVTAAAAAAAGKGSGKGSVPSLLSSAAKRDTSSHSKTATPAVFLTPGRTRSRPLVARSSSAVQPLVSPVSQSMGSGSVNAGMAANRHLLQTPRAKSGLEVETSGSLWDRSTTSPITSGLGVAALAAAAAAPSTPKACDVPRLLTHNYKKKKKGDSIKKMKVNGGGNGSGKNLELPPKRESGGRDQFEDALIRALDEKWENGRGAGAGAAGVVMGLSRSNSTSDGGPTAMLRAVKTWTCVCQFENSVGQTSCLGCGRVAPLSRPTTPARRRLPAHRMNSNIPPPSEDDL